MSSADVEIPGSTGLAKLLSMHVKPFSDKKEEYTDSLICLESEA